MSAYQLPIIDLRELDDPSTRENFYQKLRFTAREIGFFILLSTMFHRNNEKIY
ncbi:hypothetical protein AB6G19_17585 [Providencia manganoxydans]